MGPRAAGGPWAAAVYRPVGQIQRLQTRVGLAGALLASHRRRRRETDVSINACVSPDRAARALDAVCACLRNRSGPCAEPPCLSSASRGVAGPRIPGGADAPRRERPRVHHSDDAVAQGHTASTRREEQSLPGEARGPRAPAYKGVGVSCCLRNLEARARPSCPLPPPRLG